MVLSLGLLSGLSETASRRRIRQLHSSSDAVGCNGSALIGAQPIRNSIWGNSLPPKTSSRTAARASAISSGSVNGPARQPQGCGGQQHQAGGFSRAQSCQRVILGSAQAITTAFSSAEIESAGCASTVPANTRAGTGDDWLPTIRRAAALVSDTGGMTCHAAIVARELGVRCVVGTRTATKDLHDGTTVTVDGTQGRVLSGRVDAAPAVSVAEFDESDPG